MMQNTAKSGAANETQLLNAAHSSTPSAPQISADTAVLLSFFGPSSFDPK
jgi:hypothetical protein